MNTKKKRGLWFVVMILIFGIFGIFTATKETMENIFPDLANKEFIEIAFSRDFSAKELNNKHVEARWDKQKDINSVISEISFSKTTDKYVVRSGMVWFISSSGETKGYIAYIDDKAKTVLILTKNGKTAESKELWRIIQEIKNSS